MGRKNFKDLQEANPLTAEGEARKHAIKRALRDAMSLAELRNERGVTQTDLAGGLGVTQKRVSQIESADNVYLSTLRDYVHELGGELELSATFDGERVPLRIG
jgi:DNA-binding XRE family transcriptional regulator